MTARPFLDFRPNPDDGTPLYLQVARLLSNAVSAGHFRVNDALPAERSLAENLGISRVTARKALAHLSANGQVVRVRGSGNYVAPIEVPLTKLSGFSEDMTKRGYQPGSQWISRSITEAHSDEQLTFGLSASNTRIARLERLRLHEGAPMSYEICVLPEEFVPNPWEVENSLYELLARRGHMPVRALQRFKAVNADADVAAKLGIPEGLAVFFITRVGYLASGIAVEITTSYCRSEYFDFVAEMRRDL
jgi:GntR family transcriptional regulator